jgi:hypothetical protein
MSILLLVLFSLYFIIYTPILVVRIAKYGKSFIKPNFQEAFEKLNEDNEIGRILVQHKGFIVLNAISYYLILLIWLAIIGGIIFWLIR